MANQDICKQCGTAIDAGDPTGLCAECGTPKEGAPAGGAIEPPVASDVGDTEDNPERKVRR